MLRNAPHSMLSFFTRTLLPLLLLCAVLGAPVPTAAGEPAAHHHGVEIASIDVMQIAVTHTHGEPSLSVLTRTNRAVAIS